MGNFNRGRGGDFHGNRGGSGGFRGGRDSGRPNFRREDRGPVIMTKVICDVCKKACEVPFRPTAGKPVYCNDCFRNQSGGSQDRAPRRDFGDRSQALRPIFPHNEGGNDIKKQLELLNSKIDKLILSIESFIQAKSSSKKETKKKISKK